MIGCLLIQASVSVSRESVLRHERLLYGADCRTNASMAGELARRPKHGGRFHTAATRFPRIIYPGARGRGFLPGAAERAPRNGAFPGFGRGDTGPSNREEGRGLHRLLGDGRVVPVLRMLRGGAARGQRGSWRFWGNRRDRGRASAQDTQKNQKGRLGRQTHVGVTLLLLVEGGGEHTWGRRRGGVSPQMRRQDGGPRWRRTSGASWRAVRRGPPDFLGPMACCDSAPPTKTSGAAGASVFNAANWRRGAPDVSGAGPGRAPAKALALVDRKCVRSTIEGGRRQW